MIPIKYRTETRDSSYTSGSNSTRLTLFQPIRFPNDQDEVDKFHNQEKFSLIRFIQNSLYNIYKSWYWQICPTVQHKVEGMSLHTCHCAALWLLRSLSFVLSRLIVFWLVVKDNVFSWTKPKFQNILLEENIQSCKDFNCGLDQNHNSTEPQLNSCHYTFFL